MRAAPGVSASLAATLVLVACATHETTTGAIKTAAEPDPNAVAFQAAVRDASGQSVANVHDGLFAVADDNPLLVWREPAARTQLKVASLMSQPTYDRYYAGRSSGTTTGLHSWVTAVPQVRAFCRATGLSGEALRTRLRQYLGLAPGRRYDLFVEFWVDRSDLFRPCPDPEIDDTACRVAFPVSGGMPEAPAVKGVDDYLAWFTRTYAASYGDGGVPWTRLGYTYDWNPATPKVGASEYLITVGAAWEIAGVTPIDAYCAP